MPPTALHTPPASLHLTSFLTTGLVSIPKSSNPSRCAQNFDCLDWELSEDAMASINTLESAFRYVTSYSANDGETWHDGTVEEVAKL